MGPFGAPVGRFRDRIVVVGRPDQGPRTGAPAPPSPGRTTMVRSSVGASRCRRVPRAAQGRQSGDRPRCPSSRGQQAAVPRRCAPSVRPMSAGGASVQLTAGAFVVLHGSGQGRARRDLGVLPCAFPLERAELRPAIFPTRPPDSEDRCAAALAEISRDRAYVLLARARANTHPSDPRSPSRRGADWGAQQAVLKYL